MKRLFILRHAKSSWDSPAGRDFERPLDAGGEAAAQAIGLAMRKRGLKFDLVLASPAVRVRQTLAGAEEGYGRPLEPVFERRIYDADPEALLDLVRHADDKAEHLLLVGHNPGLHELLLRLAGDDEAGHRGKVAARYPTGTLAEVELDIEGWRDAAAGQGRIVSLTMPSDL